MPLGTRTRTGAMVGGKGVRLSGVYVDIGQR